jgi:hypothetical protein
MRIAYFLILIAVIFLSGCSKKVWLYLGSGFDSKNVTIITKDNKKQTYLVKDSILTTNDVIGLTLYREIRLKKCSKNYMEFKIQDSTFEIEISCQNSFFCDFNDSTGLNCRELKKNEKFY